MKTIDELIKAKQEIERILNIKLIELSNQYPEIKDIEIELIKHRMIDNKMMVADVNIDITLI